MASKRARTIVDFFGRKKQKMTEEDKSDGQHAENVVSTDPDNIQSGANDNNDAVNVIVNPEADIVDPEPDSTKPTKASVENKKYKHTYQTSWENKFPWLYRKNTEPSAPMFCRVCIKHKKSNAMASDDGCTNFRHSTLARHAATQDHCDALQADVMMKTFEQAANTAVKRSAAEPGIVSALRTVYWLAKEDLSVNKYPSIMEFQKLQGCSDLANISIAKNATYNSRNSAEEFLECISDIINERIVKKLRESDMFSILIDESTDISVSKQMVVYARYVDTDFEPHTHFLGNITINNPKSDSQVLFNAVQEFLISKGLEINHVYGFGSDGAAVMVGRHKGVATRITNLSLHCIAIHCLAHRLNLTTSQASKDVPYLKTFEQLLTDLFYYFGGTKSGNRQCELSEIQKILDDPQVKIKECHEIRWIAFQDAVHAVFKSWKSLVEFFKRHSDSKSKSHLRKLTEYKFVAVLYLMMDILPFIAHLSLIFQKVNIDVSAINPAIDGLKDKIKLAKDGKSYYQKEFFEVIVKTKENEEIKKIEYKGVKLDIGENMKKTTKDFLEVRELFCKNLLKNIEMRFPKDSLSVAMAFQIFGLRPISFLSEEDKESYGLKELDILIKHYGHDITKGDITSKKLIDGNNCIQEWSLIKKIVLEQRYPRDKISTLWKLIFTYHKDTVPNLLKLANLALIMPYQTADCERGFSCQNSIKTNKRNRLKENMLNHYMNIKLEGGPIEAFDFAPVVAHWKRLKERKIFKY